MEFPLQVGVILRNSSTALTREGNKTHVDDLKRVAHHGDKHVEKHDYLHRRWLRACRCRVCSTYADHVVGGHHATTDHLGEHVRLDDICVARIGDSEKRPDQCGVRVGDAASTSKRAESESVTW